MNCPKCDTPMQTRKLARMKLDDCPKCGGAWFDRDELRRTKDVTDPDLNWMDFEIWKHKDRFHAAARPLKCPRCSVTMAAVDYDDTGIEIDCCARCQGVWLDRDEFAKIIDALDREVNTKDFSDYVRESLQEAKEIVTGPESVISEWRDFTTVLRMLEYRMFADNPKLLNAVTAVQEGNPIV